MDTVESWSGLDREALCGSLLTTGEEDVDSWLVSPCSACIQPSSTPQVGVSVAVLATAWRFQVEASSPPHSRPCESYLAKETASDTTPDKEVCSSIWTLPADGTDLQPCSSFLSPATCTAAHKQLSTEKGATEASTASIRRKGRRPNPIACFFCSEIVPYKRTFIHHLSEVHGIRRSQSLMYKRLKEGSEAIKRRYCGPRRIFKVTLTR